MKKILLFTLFIYISFPTYTSAAGVCLIKDKAAPALLDYIKENRTIVKNITKAVVKEKNKYFEDKQKERKRDKGFLGNQLSGINEQLTNSKEKITSDVNFLSSTFNEMFNFTSYYSYFTYFVTYPISNEIPYEVKRDYKILDRENEGMLGYLSQLDANNNTKIIINDACIGITKGLEVCKKKFNGLSSKEIMGKLLQNNDLILDLYRTTVIGESKIFNFKDFILVDNNFILDITKYYNTNASNQCSQNKGGFFEQISTAIKEIKLLNKQGEDGIKKWKDAYQLMVGNKPEEEGKIAKRELKKYLSNNGVQMQNQKILQDTLKKYNNEGISENNNFLTNSFKGIKKKISTELGKWKKEVITDFIKKKNEKEKKQYSITNLLEIESRSKITIDIRERISNIYEIEVPFSAVGDITTENLRAKIISTHFKLDSAIKTLDNTIKVSRKVCKAQDGSQGNCQ